MQFTPDGKFALIPHANASSLVVADVATQAIVKSIPLGMTKVDKPSTAGVFPHPDNRHAFVTVRNDNSMLVLDLTTGETLGTGRGAEQSRRRHLLAGAAVAGVGTALRPASRRHDERSSPKGLTRRRGGIVAVLEAVVAERIHSAIDRVWTVEQEARYLAALSDREAVHVAVDASAGIVGLQSLDLWSSLLASMSHVGQLGTFLLPAWRGRGIGRRCGTPPRHLRSRPATASWSFRFAPRIPAPSRSIAGSASRNAGG